MNYRVFRSNHHIPEIKLWEDYTLNVVCVPELIMIETRYEIFSFSSSLKSLVESIFEFFAWLGDVNLDEREHLMQPIKIEQNIKNQ